MFDLLSRPADVVLTATAANQSGSISQVEFTANGEPVGVGVLSGTNQYSRTLTNLPTGTYSIRAIVTDGNGVKSYSYPVKIYVADAPTISITSPATGTSFAKPVNLTLTASAKDFDGYVGTVEFFLNGTDRLGIGTLTQDNIYSFTWMRVWAGNHTVTATATDNQGKISTSNPVNITVTNVAPSVSITDPANGETYPLLSTIHFLANALDSDGSARWVEFYDGTTLIGGVSGNQPNFFFNWYNVTAGTHIITAKAFDDDNASTTSSAISITVNPMGGDALLVVGNTTLSGVDNAIKTRLQNLGLNVVVKSATAASSADATGKRVVVISDSVSPTNVNTKFRAVAVPVVTLDPQLFDDMGMTATTSGNFGTSGGQNAMPITNPSHPMAAGLNNTVDVTSANATFAWGKPNANAIKIATLWNDATKATIYGYETNALMLGLSAPSRRVGFFYTASSASLTTHGGWLFDNAIKWAAGL